LGLLQSWEQLILSDYVKRTV